MLSGGKFANGAHATTGTVEGALMGGFTAAVTAGVGHGNAGNSIFGGKVATALGHGVTKGAISEIRGGEFKDGFVGGVIGHFSGAAMGEVGGNGGGAVFGRTAIAAAAGGLTAEATGGSFEDGAFQAAMTHLFNKEAITNYEKNMKTAGWEMDDNGNFFRYDSRVVGDSNYTVKVVPCSGMGSCLDMTNPGSQAYSAETERVFVRDLSIGLTAMSSVPGPVGWAGITASGTVSYLFDNNVGLFASATGLAATRVPSSIGGVILRDISTASTAYATAVSIGNPE